MFDTFTFDEDGHESAHIIDHVLAKFESRCLPQRNVTYERYLFNKREQELAESIDQYCTALMRLSEHCGFGNLRESLIRDRLILGVKNDRARKKLLEEKDRTLDKALDILRTGELNDIRTSEISTEEPNINRVGLKISKSPKNATEGKTSRRPTLNKRQSFSRKPKEKGSGNNTSTPTAKNRECKFYGTVHEMKKSACPAVGKKCNKCSRDGHFAKKCASSSVNHVEDCMTFTLCDSPYEQQGRSTTTD